MLVLLLLLEMMVHDADNSCSFYVLASVSDWSGKHDKQFAGAAFVCKCSMVFILHWISCADSMRWKSALSFGAYRYPTLALGHPLKL